MLVQALQNNLPHYNFKFWKIFLLPCDKISSDEQAYGVASLDDLDGGFNGLM